jgi:clan AA aspartic protease (TIGR02281 family)
VLRVAPLLILALLCAASASGEGEIYRWMDSEGGIHFTRDLGHVPGGQRRDAVERARAPSRLQTYDLPASLGDTPAEAAATPLPPRAHGLVAGHELRIPFTQSGTLMLVQVVLNDHVQAPFLVDTGASGISIPDDVARRLGVRIDADTPRIAVQTAAGIVAEPMIPLDSVQVGAARVEGLTALVNSSMDVGLLGGSFFNNFVYQVDAAAGVITLRANESVRGGLPEAQWRDRFRSARGELERLERYVAGQEEESSRRSELERNLRGLRDALDALEAEANGAGVPRSWRE